MKKNAPRRPATRKNDAYKPKKRFDDNNRDRKPFSRFDDERPKKRFDDGDRDRKPFSRFDDERPKKRFDDGDRDRKPFSRFDDERPKKRFDDSDDLPNKRRDDDGKSKEKSRKRIATAKKPKHEVAHTTSAAVRDLFDNSENGVRLNKYIAHSGLCSRRTADEWIAAGKILVNDEVVREMGFRVQRSDEVKYEGNVVLPVRKIYVLVNKPKDMITTTDDPEGRKTVMDLVAGATEERLYPVGRLDRNTTGLLLLTNDGELAQKMSHPSYEVNKIYHVTLDKPFSKNDLRTLLDGIELEDGAANIDDAYYLDDIDKSQLAVRLHIGRNRIVRRLFEHLGYQVEKLDRVQYASLTKKDLLRGKWRFLSDKEVIFLKYFKN